MAESWAYDFAAGLKDKSNPRGAGPCTGRVVSVDPLKVQIMGGTYLLTRQNCDVCRGAIRRRYEVRLLGEMRELIYLNRILMLGDRVLVVPDATFQHFYIVDVLEEGWA